MKQNLRNYVLLLLLSITGLTVLQAREKNTVKPHSPYKHQVASVQPDINGIIYVDSSNAAPGDGSSWAKALNYLSDATKEALTDTEIQEIHVAKGTYYPTGAQSGTSRDSTFLLIRGGLRLLGGYPSGGGTRDYQHEQTILSGNINASGNADNSFHVMVIAGIAEDADSLIIDGLNFRDGMAIDAQNRSHQYNGNAVSNDYGGGLAIYNAYGNHVNLRYCNILDNIADNGGGGIFISSGEPLIFGCHFTANRSAQIGGGICSVSSSATIANTAFSKNTAGTLGGGLYFYNYLPTLRNLLITDNTAANGGAIGITNIGYQLQAIYVENLTISGNTASNLGGGLYNENSYIVVTNSIVWGNKATNGHDLANVSGNGSSADMVHCIYGALPGDILPGDGFGPISSIAGDPLFTDTAAGMYTLLPASPAIDSGANDDYIAGGGDLTIDQDIAGHARLNGSTIDIGAFEFSENPLPVKLQRFEGSLSQFTVHLVWQSGAENGLDHFELEKSVDGKRFIKAGSFPALGNGHLYETTLPQIEPLSYYRLKQVDQDDKFSYYEKILRLEKMSNEDQLSVYPNPAHDYLNLHASAPGILSVFAADGRQVFKNAVTKGDNQIDIRRLANGVYYAVLNGRRINFIKEK